MNATNPIRRSLGLLLLVAWGCGGGAKAPAAGTGPAALSVACSSSAALVGSAVTVLATVLKGDGTPVAAGTAVSFTASGGAVVSGVTPTDASGTATASVTSSVRGSVQVSATAGSLAGTQSVAFLDPTVAIVKVGTTGTVPAGTTIGGVNAIVTARPSTGLTLGAGDHALSGGSAGSMLVANPGDLAADNMAVINAAGFAAGEFATLTYHLAPGVYPAASDFSVAPAGPGVIDTAGLPIPGTGVGILSVTVR